MSAWTDEEVDQLEQRGGNNVARRTWLKHAPPMGQGGRPQPGSDLAIFKAFVVDVYERKIYYGNDDESTIPGTPAPLFASTPIVKIKHTKTVIAAAPMSAPPPPVVDLLDFVSVPESLPSTQTDLFQPNFANFSTIASATSTPSFPCFDTMTTTAPIHTFAADFHGLVTSTTPAIAIIPPPSTATTTATTTTQKPIMGGMSATNSFAISNWMGTVPPLTATCDNNIDNMAAGTNMMNNGMQQYNMMMNNGMQHHNGMMNNGMQHHNGMMNNGMMNNGMQQQNGMMNNGCSGMNHMQQQNLLMMQQQLMLQMNNGSMNPQQQQQMMTMMQQQRQMTGGVQSLQMNGSDGMQKNHQGGTMFMSKSTNNGTQFPSHWP